MSLKGMPELEWQPLSLEHIDELRLALSEKNPEVSELSLANLFLWREFDRPHLARSDSCLCLRLSPPNEPAYVLEPLGPSPSSSLLQTCLDSVGRLSRIPRSFLSFLPAEGVIIRENRDQYDYVYDREELATLRGKKFDGKRNLIRRFQATHPDYEFRPMGRQMGPQALDFFHSWAAKKAGSTVFQPLTPLDQATALEIAFDLWDKLDILGGVLVSQREIKGFIIASRLNKETATVHFQYADLGSPGAPQTLLWEACRSLLRPFSLINLEQDLGLAGLRKAKLSYHPLRLVVKYDVELASQARKF